MIARLIFRHLSFIGTAKPVSTLPFADGPNVIYGASNTGKSFTLAALQFMLGKSTPLPVIEQLDGYEAVLLGLDVPSLGPITLYRSIQGAGFRLYEGLHHEPPPGAPFRVLDAEYEARTENITSVLLGALGLGGKFVVKNENGEKNSVTLRSLDPFIFVDEGSIIDARSPILSGQYTSATAEKNLFRLLLTGRDDSAIVAVVPPKIRKARQEGQKELLKEWIASLDAQIDAIGIPRQQLDDQSKRIDASLIAIQGDLAKRQRRIDEVTRERRRMVDEADRVTAQAREIELTLARFARLMEVYESDVERLGALEQGGHLLLARLDRPCPLCGAEVDHQNHQGRQDVERSRVAARVEIARIDRERRDLVATMNGLEADFATNLATSERLRRRMAAAERILGALRPEESGLRDEYEQRIEARDTVRERLKLFEERDRLAVQLSQVTTAPTATKPNSPSASTGRLATNLPARCLRCSKLGSFQGIRPCRSKVRPRIYVWTARSAVQTERASVLSSTQRSRSRFCSTVRTEACLILACWRSTRPFSPTESRSGCHATARWLPTRRNWQRLRYTSISTFIWPASVGARSSLSLRTAIHLAISWTDFRCRPSRGIWRMDVADCFPPPVVRQLFRDPPVAIVRSQASETGSISLQRYYS